MVSEIPPSERITETDHDIPAPMGEAEKFAAIVKNLLSDTLAPFLRELVALRTRVDDLEARLQKVERHLFGEAAE